MEHSNASSEFVTSFEVGATILSQNQLDFNMQTKSEVIRTKAKFSADVAVNYLHQAPKKFVKIHHIQTRCVFEMHIQNGVSIKCQTF